MDSDREELLSRLLKLNGPAVERRIGIPRDLRSVISAEDVMQEAFVDAFLAIERMPERDEEFRSWLSTIAANNLRDAIRVSRALKRDAGRRVQCSAVNVLIQPVRGNTPSGLARRVERAKILRQAAALLPEPYRTAAAAMLDDESANGVAARLGKSIGSTYVVMGRTRKLLGQALWKQRSEMLSSGVQPF